MRTGLRFAILAVLVMTVGVLVVARYKDVVLCSPAFLSLGAKEIVTTSEASKFSARFAIVGCDADLRSIGPRELVQIRSTMEVALRDYGWRFLNAPADRELRRALVVRVNHDLGRRVASDIFAYSFSAEE